jgi:hypothetical protein
LKCQLNFPFFFLPFTFCLQKLDLHFNLLMAFEIGVKFDSGGNEDKMIELSLKNIIHVWHMFKFPNLPELVTHWSVIPLKEIITWKMCWQLSMFYNGKKKKKNPSNHNYHYKKNLLIGFASIHKILIIDATSQSSK